jgi:PIN domain nuclease of toxin-antitoxin system
MHLLDSHILLWMLTDDERLKAPIRATLVQAAPQVFVSAASVWELSIKHALGKLPMPDDLVQATLASGLQPLPITLAHALAAGALPPHHRDPFDRMLVAQAQLEGLTLVTHDARIRPYDVSVLWA